MQGCTNERSYRVLWAALGLTIYRGEGGGCAPSRVPTPRGAAALDGKGEAAKRRFPPPPRHIGGAFPLWDSSLLKTLGAWASWGWCPWPMQASGACGPYRWTPGTLLWSWYITGDTRNTSSGQNLTSYILFFTPRPFQNSS